MDQVFFIIAAAQLPNFILGLAILTTN